MAIPYLTPAGVVEIKFRAIDPEDTPKYIYSANSTAQRIYNAPALFDDRDYMCVCEGEPDVWTADQCGFPVVGIPGVNNWRPYFARVFAGYREVIILGDADDGAGQGESFAKDLARLITNARVCLMPRGHDVNSFYVAEGADALRDRIGVK